MYISENLIFLELHKTGCTHIRKLLHDLVPGKACGKHNQLSREQLSNGKKIIGSVRNPWDWYVSLWAYGCDQKGAIYSKVTRKSRIKFRGNGWKDEPWPALMTFIHSLRRKPELWARTYQNPNDPGCFREWLQLIHDKSSFHDIGEQYGVSNVSPFAGILTYRFLKLFCCTVDSSIGIIKSFDQLKEFEARNSFVDYFVRNEYLEHDLITALDFVGVKISAEKRKQICAVPKTNTSSRKRSTDFYYDDASRDLVQMRERIIIDKFEYTFDL